MTNNINNEWENFLKTDTFNLPILNESIEIDNSIKANLDHNIPKCSDIYISTKTKISFLNKAIDLNDLFWKLPIEQYHIPKEGIIKKQIKIQSFDRQKFNTLNEKINEYYYYKSHIINNIDNPSGKIPFKDTRKVSIGISKKDIINYRCKEKSAFYNCFVVVIRILYEQKFKEIHIKIFNTGKLEIPGIKYDDMLHICLDQLIELINKVDGYGDIKYCKDKTENVLINSNFNCGYFINREILFDILRNKYNINSCYDPCSYPGIQSEFYYNIIDKNFIQTGVQPIKFKEHYIKISFMIFRTGSVLMVGKCDEPTLYQIYEFLKNLLCVEYNLIHYSNINSNDINKNKTVKKKKLKKKIIYIEN
mgnify:FL=1